MTQRGLIIEGDVPILTHVEALGAEWTVEALQAWIDSTGRRQVRLTLLAQAFDLTMLQDKAAYDVSTRMGIFDFAGIVQGVHRAARIAVRSCVIEQGGAGGTRLRICGYASEPPAAAPFKWPTGRRGLAL